jgi:hypothetical protein
MLAPLPGVSILAIADIILDGRVVREESQTILNARTARNGQGRHTAFSTDFSAQFESTPQALAFLS